jgi:hypothetical protein
MPRSPRLLRALTASFLLLLPLANAEDFGVRIVFGDSESQPASYDGSLSLRNGGTVRQLEGWRFDAGDSISGLSWKLSMHPMRTRAAAKKGRIPVVGNGVIAQITGATGSSELDVRTTQGNFTLRLADIPFGKPARPMNGRALVERIPSTTALDKSPDEDDYPAAAASANGDVWIAYLRFQHHPNHNRLRANKDTAPADFNESLSAPGGDQLFARRRDAASGAWSTPIALTATGRDLYKPAIAIDGKGRAWVFYSENASYAPPKNNTPGPVPDFELWVRPVSGDTPGTAIRISKAAGADVFPSATTDAAGRVWVTWQGWRDGRAAIFAAMQNGDGFGAPMTVASSKGNEWNPVIAATSNGNRITVAWDSYRNGNYDIFLRTYANNRWGTESAALASARYEAHPSIAYAPDGRLWLAYEEGTESWGKDWGADESSGFALYQGRAIRVRAFEPDGKSLATIMDIGDIAPGPATPRLLATSKQADPNRPDWTKPVPDRWKQRPNASATQALEAPKNSYPRLTIDASGRVWLAFRSNHPTWWSPLGTVWTEYVTSYTGATWLPATYLAHSDAVLDNRPALVSPKAGDLLIITAADGRREFEGARQQGAQALKKKKKKAATGNVVRDPYNFNLYASTMSLGPATAKPQLQAAAPSPASGPADDPEQKSIAAMRAVTVAGKYKIARGEFHRHSEISADGGNDGSLLDQWRYALDAAHMDWFGCCDHDNGGGREYTWWTSQKLTDVFYAPGKFVPLFSYERSVRYPEGHRNVLFAQRGVRTLPRLPISDRNQPQKAPDTQMLYRYLKQFNGIVAMHTSGTSMGTDWRDNDAQAEPFVEIYQGERQNYEMPGAPRSNSANDSIGGWEPLGFVSLALEMGHKLAFEASSDHISTHMSYANALTTGFSRAELLSAFQQRHVYGATDNILAEFSSGNHIMGDEFTTSTSPEFRIKLTGTAPFAKVHIIKNSKYVYTVEPKTATVSFTWRDTTPTSGRTSYYYVRGEQEDGEVVWVSPMWVNYTGK